MPRFALIFLGWASVIIAVIGIFLPLVPTTPLLLLASWCFAKSSPKFHHWLHSHPKLGPIVTAFESNEGVDLKIKVRAIVLIWLTMGASILIIGRPMVTAILITTGLGVSVYLAFILPTRKHQPDVTNQS